MTACGGGSIMVWGSQVVEPPDDKKHNNSSLPVPVSTGGTVHALVLLSSGLSACPPVSSLYYRLTYPYAYFYLVRISTRFVGNSSFSLFKLLRYDRRDCIRYYLVLGTFPVTVTGIPHSLLDAVHFSTPTITRRSTSL